jgi:hypothetical protein
MKLSTENLKKSGKELGIVDCVYPEMLNGN